MVLKNLDTDNWVHRDDGYYYRHILKEGETTAPLFTGVSIDSSRLDDTYLDLLPEFKIQVYEESVQSAGFSDYERPGNIMALRSGKEGGADEKAD